MSRRSYPLPRTPRNRLRTTKPGRYYSGPNRSVSAEDPKVLGHQPIGHQTCSGCNGKMSFPGVPAKKSFRDGFGGRSFRPQTPWKVVSRSRFKKPFRKNIVSSPNFFLWWSHCGPTPTHTSTHARTLPKLSIHTMSTTSTAATQSAIWQRVNKQVHITSRCH